MSDAKLLQLLDELSRDGWAIPDLRRMAAQRALRGDTLDVALALTDKYQPLIDNATRVQYLLRQAPQ